MVSTTQIITIVAILLFIVLGFKLAKKIFWTLALIGIAAFILLTFVF